MENKNKIVIGNVDITYKQLAIWLILIIFWIISIILLNSNYTIEEVNKKINEKVTQNNQEIEKIKTLNNWIQENINNKLTKVFEKLNKNCWILKYSNINTEEECNKKELEKYIEKTLGYTVDELSLRDKLNALEWFKKPVSDFTKEDIAKLPKWSSIINNRVLHKYNSPDDLIYWLHVNDKPYITQGMIEHYKNNKRLATDIWAHNLSRYVYAPDWKNKEIEYTVKRVESFDYWKWVELSFKVNWANYKWIYWHTTLDKKIKDWTKVKTWDVIWFLNLTWITTWYHLHVELWQDDNQVLYSINPKVLKVRKLRNKNLHL